MCCASSASPTPAFRPAYVQQLADFAAWRGDPPPVELYSFGGEAMPKAGFDKVKRALKPRTLINGYGPTETVVTPLVWKVDASEEIEGNYAPIGRPVGRRSAYILDRDLNLAPVGVAGRALYRRRQVWRAAIGGAVS